MLHYISYIFPVINTFEYVELVVPIPLSGNEVFMQYKILTNLLVAGGSEFWYRPRNAFIT